ncbi:hypothetical protein BGX26_007804, partial [Mortierella sp. AD094]
MPGWCIQYLNANTKKTVVDDVQQAMQSLTLRNGALSLADRGTDIGRFVARVRPSIEEELGCKMAHPIRARGAGVDFRLETVVPCTLCGPKHKRNNYLARPILGPCFYMRNYSQSCIPRAYNWDSHPIIRRIIDYPATDLPYSQMLHAVFHDRNYTLVYAYKANATTGRFLCFDGLLWQELPRNVVAREVETICGTVLDNLLKYIKPSLGCKDKVEIETINMQKAMLKRGRTYISRHSSKNSILDEYRTQHGDNEIESKLDTDPDILVARNGVIDLKTGECRPGSPEDYMATKLDTDYNGLESSTKDIDEF